MNRSIRIEYAQQALTVALHLVVQAELPDELYRAVGAIKLRVADAWREEVEREVAASARSVHGDEVREVSIHPGGLI